MYLQGVSEYLLQCTVCTVFVKYVLFILVAFNLRCIWFNIKCNCNLLFYLCTVTDLSNLNK